MERPYSCKESPFSRMVLSCALLPVMIYSITAKIMENTIFAFHNQYGVSASDPGMKLVTDSVFIITSQSHQGFRLPDGSSPAGANLCTGPCLLISTFSSTSESGNSNESDNMGRVFTRKASLMIIQTDFLSPKMQKKCCITHTGNMLHNRF